MRYTEELLQKQFKIDSRVLELVAAAEEEVSGQFAAVSYTHLTLPTIA